MSSAQSEVSQNDIELSIVLPCLNEARTIAVCIKKAAETICRYRLRGEIIVADNGSTDESIQIAQSLGARVVDVAEKGYGSAVIAGALVARGHYLMLSDADDSYDLSAIWPFIQKLREGHHLVMGCRLPAGGGTIMPGAMPWTHRWIGNPFLSGLGRFLFGSPVRDFHCGLRGITRSTFQALGLDSTGFELPTEMVIKATRQGYRIAEIPITLYKDGRRRPSHLKPWRDGWRNLRVMVRASSLTRPSCRIWT